MWPLIGLAKKVEGTKVGAVSPWPYVAFSFSFSLLLPIPTPHTLILGRWVRVQVPLSYTLLRVKR
jgi:hypothetical protein